MNSAIIAACVWLTLTLPRPAGAGEPYTPGENSRERTAIINAGDTAYEQRFPKKETRMEMEELKVQDGWAGIRMLYTAKADENDSDIWLVVLRGSAAKWKVLGAFRKSDISEKDNPYDQLMARYPKMPEAVKRALDVRNPAN